jgi:hypothetical protein
LKLKSVSKVGFMALLVILCVSLLLPVGALANDNGQGKPDKANQADTWLVELRTQELARLRAMKASPGDLSVSSANALALASGETISFTEANISDSYYYGWLAQSSASGDQSQNRNNVGIVAYGPGGHGNGWAWTGVSYTAPSGMEVAVNFYGHGSYQIWGYLGGSAHWSVYCRIYDATDAVDVGEYCCWERSQSNMPWPKSGGAYFAKAISTNLVAGHEYYFYVITYGDAAQWTAGTSICRADDDSHHTYWSEIDVNVV